jgi:hypothetical protein
MKTFAAVLFISLAISALIYAISSGNHLRLWLRYDGKLHLRVRLYLLEGLFLYDFMISGGEAVRMSKKDRRLLSLVFRKKNKKSKSPFSPKAGDILQLLKKCKLQWSLRMELGTDDAAQTALICGALMSFLRASALFSLSIIPLQVQKINVSPVMRPCANINFSCMFSIKTGHIIIAAAKLALRGITAKASPGKAQKSQTA